MAIILCRVVWAEHYCGEKNFYAGHMKYPAKHKTAHEIWNFANENGVAYGFVEHKGDRINLSRLGGKKQTTLDDVTVIWCAVDEKTQRLRVVGWYDNATAYKEARKTKRAKADDEWTYQFKTEFKDAHLIPVSERDLEVPGKRNRTDKGFIGQRNWFFPEGSAHYGRFLEAFELLRKGQADTVDRASIDRESFDEGQRFIAEVRLTVRNPKLVAAAKARYGYRCQVCDFSFDERYGSIGKGFIEVHHLSPLKASHGKRAISTDDVCVLCANCHRMIHKKDPPLTLSDLKGRLRRA